MDWPYSDGPEGMLDPETGKAPDMQPEVDLVQHPSGIVPQLQYVLCIR